MPEVTSGPEIQATQEAKVGRIEAVLGTLRHNKNVQEDIVAATLGATLGAAMGGPEGLLLGGYLGSLTRKVFSLVDENGRRAQAVAGEPVDRSVADDRHLFVVLMEAIRNRTVQMPKVEQMNADSIRAERYARHSTHR